MKSLSDYTKILRDTATNLNLHGESVEMVVQMLANALYISEVEHVAYTQEASLERSTLENSKIQHCVNQMYSVYRGANPRVILNFRASKLFTFKPHQEIIKSNNYKVYYLGYFNETDKTIRYSDLTIYPDTTVTIIGILSQDTVSVDWTSTSDNPYYYTLTESDLSGDLYLDVSGKRTDVTRIFSDHLKFDLPFDLTIPGYGMRLYYPEPLQGDKGINTEYSLSVYKYMSLSGIQESEKKALKMTGAKILSFGDVDYDRTWILNTLGAEETYPGVIFIPETPRDALETIHHKANRNRYSGTYLATNSDLSWLLQEYYPGKIRRLGVTYRFESPESTSLEEVSSSSRVTIKNGVFLKYKDLESSLGKWINAGLGYLPKGELKFKYKRSKEPTGTNSSYEIIPSASVIPVRTSVNYMSPGIPEISIGVLKNTGGQIKLLTTYEELKAEGLQVFYRFPTTHGIFEELGENDNLRILITDTTVSGTSDRPLEIQLIQKNTKKELDFETIPYTFIPVTLGVVEVRDPETQDITEVYKTVTEEGPGDYYTLDLSEDTIYLKTTQTGEITGSSEITASLFYNGKQTQGVSYSIIASSNIEASIDSGTGVITITGMSDGVLESSLVVKARYNGMNFQGVLKIYKTISNLGSSTKEMTFSVTSDLTKDYPLATYTVYGEQEKAVIEVPENKYKSLSISLPEGVSIEDITFTDAVFVYSYQVINNILTGNEDTTPTLHLYYIPYSGSNPLDKEEITKFISTNKAYYITQDIKIDSGRAVVAKFDVSLDLYKNTSIDEMILEILQRYSYLFNQDFGKTKRYTKDPNEISQIVTDTYSEIKSLITKISEVRNVEDIKITYLNPTSRKEITYDEIKESDIPVYFIIECVISSVVRT